MKKIVLSCLVSLVFIHTNAQNSDINQKINIELINGNYQSVIQLTNKYLNTEYNEQFLYKNALANRLNYNYKQALLATSELASKHPQNVDYLLEHSRNLINSNRMDSAKNTLVLIFNQLDTTKTSAGILLGKIYENIDDWRNATQTYGQLIQIDYNNSYYLYHYSIGLTNLKKGNLAVPYLQKAIEKDPEHINSRYLLFRIYKALNEYELALAQIDSIKTLTPTNYKPYVDLGNYNYAKNYNYKALPEYLKAIELGSTDEDVWHSVGQCYYKIKKYQEALPYLKYRTSPIENPITFSTIAECYSKLNKNDSALLYYEKAYKLIMPDPSFLESYYEHKAKNQLAEGKFDDAIASYHKFIMQTEGLRWAIFYKNNALEKIAAIYIENKQEPEKALELYKIILTETSEYKNPNLFKYYEQKVIKLNEELFFNAK